MGVGNFISSLTDTVKSYTLDLTSVYGYTSSTVSKVDNAVRSNVGPKLTGYLPDAESCAKIGQKLSEHLPDDEGRAKIGRFAWNFGKNAVVWGLHESAKWVPGGSFIRRTILRSLPDEKNENLKKTVKTLETRIATLEKQASGSGKSCNWTEVSSPNTKSNSQTSSCLNPEMNIQKREDVISKLLVERLISKL